MYWCDEYRQLLGGKQCSNLAASSIGYAAVSTNIVYIVCHRATPVLLHSNCFQSVTWPYLLGLVCDRQLSKSDGSFPAKKYKQCPALSWAIICQFSSHFIDGLHCTSFTAVFHLSVPDTVFSSVKQCKYICTGAIIVCLYSDTVIFKSI